MSGTYTPRLGDKVRATLGENVLVGEVCELGSDVDPHSTGVTIDVPDAKADYLYIDMADGWQFEQVVSVPSKFGAVIRREDGKRFTRVTIEEEEGAWVPNGDQDFYDTSSAVMGGFSVLFDGVDG